MRRSITSITRFTLGLAAVSVCSLTSGTVAGDHVARTGDADDLRRWSSTDASAVVIEAKPLVFPAPKNAKTLRAVSTVDKYGRPITLVESDTAPTAPRQAAGRQASRQSSRQASPRQAQPSPQAQPSWTRERHTQASPSPIRLASDVISIDSVKEPYAVIGAGDVIVDEQAARDAAQGQDAGQDAGHEVADAKPVPAQSDPKAQAHDDAKQYADGYRAGVCDALRLEAQRQVEQAEAERQRQAQREQAKPNVPIYGGKPYYGTPHASGAYPATPYQQPVVVAPPAGQFGIYLRQEPPNVYVKHVYPRYTTHHRYPRYRSVHVYRGYGSCGTFYGGAHYRKHYRHYHSGFRIGAKFKIGDVKVGVSTGDYYYGRSHCR